MKKEERNEGGGSRVSCDHKTAEVLGPHIGVREEWPFQCLTKATLQLSDAYFRIKQMTKCVATGSERSHGQSKDIKHEMRKR